MFYGRMPQIHLARDKHRGAGIVVRRRFRAHSQNGKSLRISLYSKQKCSDAAATLLRHRTAPLTPLALLQAADQTDADESERALRF